MNGDSMRPHFPKLVIAALCAIAAACSLWLAAPVQAQSSDQQQLVFRNDSPNCAWITLYGYNAGGIGGIFTAWHIIGGAARPRNVPAHSSYTFNIRRTPRLEVRAEVYRSGCNHPLAADIRKEQNNVRNLDILRMALQKNGNSFGLSQPYGN
jgi:hypothetical protein